MSTLYCDPTIASRPSTDSCPARTDASTIALRCADETVRHGVIVAA